MTISEFKLRIQETLYGLIDTYFGNDDVVERMANSTLRILVKTNINKFDNILNMFANENGVIDTDAIVDEYSRQIGDGIRIDIRKYINNDFIRSLLPEKVLLVTREDLNKLIG